MKIGAIIAEYNPIHKGHIFQIEEFKKQGAEGIIIILSGDFTQRGIPSIYNKHVRCQMALENGADLVLELPTYFATGSAEFFAKGAVSILDQLGCINMLHFGSESGDIASLAAVSQILVKEPEAFKKTLNEELKKGNSFPKARSSALSVYLSQNNLDTGIASLCASPNNTLAIEYMKELLLLKSDIIPMTVKRAGSGYHASELPTQGSEQFASANAIRNAILSGNENNIEKYLPANVMHKMQRKEILPVFTRDFSSILLYKLLEENTKKDLSSFYDVSSQLSDIILKNLPSFSDWEQFALACKSKEYTYARINRCLLHILLNMKNDLIEEIKATPSSLYGRILGFNANGQEILRIAKKNSSIPLITKLADAKNKLGKTGNSLLSADLYAAEIYECIFAQKYHCQRINEYKQSVIRL